MAEEPVVYMSKKTWQYSKGNRPKLIFYICLSVVKNLIYFLQPLVVAYLLNTIQKEGVTSNNLTKLFLITSLFVVITIITWVLHAPSRILERKNAFHVRANYKKYLIDGVLSLPPEWHTEHHSGDTIDKIEKGTIALYNFAGGTYDIIESVIRLITSVAVLFYFNFSSGIVVIFIAIIAVLIVLGYDKRLRNHYREINHAENATSQKVFDVISNITTIIILRVQKIASSQIFKKIMHPFKTYEEYVTINELKWALVSLLSSCMYFFVLMAYFLVVVSTGEAVLIGTVFALYSYVDNISGLFYRFAYKYSDIVMQKSAVENAEELAVDFKTECINCSPISKDWRSIEIKHLTFSYDEPNFGKKRKDHIDLKDVDMKIRKGEKIALIGESGSGKTTFLKLIRGLYTPSEIDLRVDDKRITNFDDISESITLIPQDPEIFTTTIKENITMGMEYDDNMIKKHTNLACFTNVADRLPNKLLSNIKEKGVNLSGGEKQRLALSRGLLACEGKEIILLDEPTSSVDSRNELQIYKNIFNEYKHKTMLSTVHRLHLLPLFDNIYYFKDGKIIARGSMHKLLKDYPEFRSLWKKYNNKRKKI